jgi:hypothetical protein
LGLGFGFDVWGLRFGVGSLGFGVWGLWFGIRVEGFGIRSSGFGFWERFFARCAEGVVCRYRVLNSAGQARLMRLRGLRRASQATWYGGQQHPPEPVKFLKVPAAHAVQLMPVPLYPSLHCVGMGGVEHRGVLNTRRHTAPLAVQLLRLPAQPAVHWTRGKVLSAELSRRPRP